MVNDHLNTKVLPCDATIAICTYNRIGTLPQTLASLKQLRGKHAFEVIVVNGPSDDGTAEYLSTHNDIRVFDSPERNLSVSRNIALANAKGRYIAFIDDDAIPEPDWLTILLNRFATDSHLSALGGFIRDANGVSFQSKFVYCDTFGRNYPCDNPDYVTFLGKEKRLYPSLTGTNVIFHRDVLIKIGGFDEAFAYFLDETDVNKRMDDAGLRVEVVPSAEIHHKYAPSHLRTKKNVSRNMYPIARSVAYFAMRHGVPDAGWEAAVERLQKFYEDEFYWKLETYTHGNITKDDFERLMLQTQEGILSGIDLHFDTLAVKGDLSQRVLRHADAKPAIIRKMRAPEDTLRLCMFSQDHARNNHGGIGRWTKLVGKGLAERGHEVTVIGEHKDPTRPDLCDFTDNGYWSHSIGGFEREVGNEMDCLGLPSGMANTAKRRLSEMQRIMPRRQFQVSSSPIWDVEGAAVIGAGAVPTILSLHTCAGLMLEAKPEWKENEQFYNDHVLRVINAEIQALRRCDMILANSTAILRDISELYKFDLLARPHVVVPHGIDDIEAPDGLLEAREAVRMATDGPVRILFLGRLEARKGVGHMVPVLRRLLEASTNIAVDFVGGRVDDAHHKMVADLIADFPQAVIWHGFLPEEDMDELMRQADIFFGPSLYESFGLIYAEAMRYSMPCVAYAAGGVPEVIEDGVDGLLAPLEDQQTLHDHLARLIADDALRARMSRAARRNFETKFHYTLMAKRLEEVYGGVIHSRKSTG